MWVIFSRPVEEKDVQSICDAALTLQGWKQSRGESDFPLVSKKGINASLGKFDW